MRFINHCHHHHELHPFPRMSTTTGSEECSEELLPSHRDWWEKVKAADGDDGYCSDAESEPQKPFSKLCAQDRRSRVFPVIRSSSRTCAFCYSVLPGTCHWLTLEVPASVLQGLPHRKLHFCTASCMREKGLRDHRPAEEA